MSLPVAILSAAYVGPGAFGRFLFSATQLLFLMLIVHSDVPQVSLIYLLSKAGVVLVP